MAIYGLSTNVTYESKWENVHSGTKLAQMYEITENRNTTVFEHYNGDH